MRSFKHWSPRYIRDRVAVWFYQQKNPNAPWLTADSIRMLDSWLRPSDRGFEWGAGRSTLWFAERVSYLTSVEHNKQWYEQTKAELVVKGAKNVNLIFAPIEGKDQSTYVKSICDIKDASLDFVLIDGRLRSHCALAAIPKICSGGILIIDNINLYVPSNSRAPDSRSLLDGPKDNCWATLQAILRNYRCVWSCNGIFDTAIYVIGCEPVE